MLLFRVRFFVCFVDLSAVIVVAAHRCDNNTQIIELRFTNHIHDIISEGIFSGFTSCANEAQLLFCVVPLIVQ